MNFVKTIIIFAGLVLTGNLHAQSTGHTYNNYINKAELSIVDGKYAEALQNYETAFARTKTSFAVDLYNACACAAKLKNTDKVLALTGRLAAKGVGEKFFTRKIFRSYANNADFIKIIRKAEVVKNEKAIMNKQYTDKLTKFFSLDTTYNGIRKRKYYHLPELPDTLRQLFTANMKNMVSLIKKEGFYTEERLGANILRDTVFGGFRQFDIAVLHYFEMGNDKPLIDELKNILLNQLNEGTIRYYQANAMMLMTAGIFGDIGEWAFQIHDCKIYRKTTIEAEWQEKIEHYRDLYCMNNLADFEKIICHKYATDSEFDFKYYLIQNPVSDMEYFVSAFNEIAKIKDCKP